MFTVPRIQTWSVAACRINGQPIDTGGFGSIFYNYKVINITCRNYVIKVIKEIKGNNQNQKSETHSTRRCKRCKKTKGLFETFPVLFEPQFPIFRT